MSDPIFTPRQERFIAEYLIDLNATQAAIRAGYSEKTASQGAAQLLANIKIKTEIEARQAKMAEKHEITADRILSELAKIGFANMQDYLHTDENGTPRLDWGHLSRTQAAALSEVTVDEFIAKTGEKDEDGNPIYGPARKVKFKLHDKQTALLSLGKHLGMFKDRVEYSGEVVHRLAQMSPDERLQRARALTDRAQRLLAPPEEDAD